MIDISTNEHVEAFPSKIAAASGSPHQWDMVMTADTDNGSLVTLGDYVSFSTYKAGAAPSGFKGKILEASADGNWYIQVTTADGAIFLYNTPVSPYGEKLLRDHQLFYNAKNDVVRGYELIDNDIFEISELGFDGALEAGKTVTYSSGKYVVGT
mgnify:CR=1 FL=1